MGVDWVLVPVPEEHEAELSVYLMRLRMKEVLPLWDLPAAVEHVAALDEEQRKALRFLVQSVVRTGPTTLPALAAYMGMSEREATGLVREINLTRVGPARGDIAYLDPPPDQQLRIFLPVADVFEQAGV